MDELEPEAIPTWQRRTFKVEHYRKRRQKVRAAKARNRTRRLNQSARYRQAQRQRPRIEHDFAEAKSWHGLDRARGRGLNAITEQTLLTGTVQNLKRLANLIHRRRPAAPAAAAMAALKGGDRMAHTVAATLAYFVKIQFARPCGGLFHNASNLCGHCRSNAVQSGISTLDVTLVQAGDGVSVDAGRDLDGGMSQALGDRRQIPAVVCEQVAAVLVAQAMHGELGQVEAPAELFEHLGGLGADVEHWWVRARSAESRAQAAEQKLAAIREIVGE